MTPEQMRALAERNEQRCLPIIVQPDELARESAATLRAAADQLEAVQAMADEAERVAREETEWWNPRDVANDLRRVLTANTAPQEGRDE